MMPAPQSPAQGVTSDMTSELPSPFAQLDRAYRGGARAARKGKPQSANPYPRLPAGTRSFTNWHSWNRGWLTASPLGWPYNKEGDRAATLTDQ